MNPTKDLKIYEHGHNSLGGLMQGEHLRQH